jgi:protein TonB
MNPRDVAAVVSFTWETPQMSINLIESEHRAQKSLGGTFVSVAVHACVITLAVYASASAGETAVKVPIDPVTVFYPQTSKRPTETGKTATHTNRSKTPRLPSPHRLAYTLPIIADPPLPPFDQSLSAIDDTTTFGTTTNGEGGAPAAGLAGGPGDSGEPLFAAQVEKPTTLRNGNPSPKYPSLLESSRVEGIVLVEFVVDTLGVIDMSTFKVLDATNDLFAESTRASLAKWHFYPAEAGGRKVKQIVQLPLRFVAPRR